MPGAVSVFRSHGVSFLTLSFAFRKDKTDTPLSLWRNLVERVRALYFSVWLDCIRFTKHTADHVAGFRVTPCFVELPVARHLSSAVRAPSPARTRRFNSCQVQLETRSAIFAVVAAFCSRSSLCDTHSARSGSFGPIESPSSFLKLRQKRFYAVVHTAKLSSRE